MTNLTVGTMVEVTLNNSKIMGTIKEVTDTDMFYIDDIYGNQWKFYSDIHEVEIMEEITNGVEIYDILENMDLGTVEVVENIQKTSGEYKEGYLMEYIVENNVKYDGYGNSGYSHYILTGYNYLVNVAIYEDGSLELSTTHRERLVREMEKIDGDICLADGNNYYPKKWSTLVKYLNKWLDK